MSVSATRDQHRRSVALDDPSDSIRLPERCTQPLLTPHDIPGNDRVITVADPFPFVLDDTLYVLAEIEGKRASGAYFKKIGAFSIGHDLRSSQYLGETWEADDGEYSFPYLLRDGDRVLMIPDASLPGSPSQKRFRIYTTSLHDFPFGWSCLHESVLDGTVIPSDKALLPWNGHWYLFVSDAQSGGRLLLYVSDDLQHWTPHPGGPVLRRGMCDRLFNRVLSTRMYGFRPWRLGGSVLLLNGQPALFLQHMYRRKFYGEAVTPLVVESLTPEHIEFRLGSRPILAADEAVAWQRMAAHQVAFTCFRGTPIVATDGFDGELWCSTLQPCEPPTGYVFGIPGNPDC